MSHVRTKLQTRGTGKEHEFLDAGKLKTRCPVPRFVRRRYQHAFVLVFFFFFFFCSSSGGIDAFCGSRLDGCCVGCRVLLLLLWLAAMGGGCRCFHCGIERIHALSQGFSHYHVSLCWNPDGVNLPFSGCSETEWIGAKAIIIITIVARGDCQSGQGCSCRHATGCQEPISPPTPPTIVVVVVVVVVVTTITLLLLL